MSLPTWTVVPERVQLLASLFIVRQQQCLTSYSHFNQPETGPTFSAGADRINVHERALRICLFASRAEVQI